MEPDMIRMCSSSSPRPLDKEDGGDFGDFAGVPPLNILPQPPGLLGNDATTFPHLSFGGLAGDPGNAVSKSHCGKLRDVSCGFPLSHPTAAAPEVERCWHEGESRSWAGGQLVTDVLTNGFEDEQHLVPPAFEPGRDRHPRTTVGSSAHSGALSRTSSPWGTDCNTYSRPWVKGGNGWNTSLPPVAVSLDPRNGEEECGTQPGPVAEEALSNGCWDECERLRGATAVVPHRVGGGLSPGTGAEGQSPLGGAESGWGVTLQNSGSVHTVSASTSGDFASFCQAVSPNSLEDFGQLRFGDVAEDNEKLNGPRSISSGDNSADFSAESSGDQGGDSDPFPSSDSFADFRSAPADPDAVPEWDAFGGQAGGGTWAAFRSEQGATYSEGEEQQQDGVTASPSYGSPHTCRRDSVPVSLCSRLENLFQASFPMEPTAETQEEVFSLWVELNGQREEQGVSGHGMPQDIWWQLQDIHGALGLKHRWPGSHSNKVLLSSLGIDSQNILFASQRSHLAAVSSQATDLGIIQRPSLEAEKITSVAQRHSGSPEISPSCPEPKQQGAPPPVQFDCSNSDRAAPLDGTSPRHAACATRSWQSPVS